MCWISEGQSRTGNRNINMLYAAISFDMWTCFPSTRDLQGVWLDGDLKRDKQISHIVKSSSLYVRQLAKVENILSWEDFEKVRHGLIVTRLDCCNAVLVGLSQALLSHLKPLQNAAARLLTDNTDRAQTHFACFGFLVLCALQNKLFSLMYLCHLSGLWISCRCVSLRLAWRAQIVAWAAMIFSPASSQPAFKSHHDTPSFTWLLTHIQMSFVVLVERLLLLSLTCTAF